MTAALPLPVRLFVRVGLLILLGMFIVWLMKVLFVFAFFGLVGYGTVCAILLLAGEKPPSLSACTDRVRGVLERIARLVSESIAHVEEDVKSLAACFSRKARPVQEPVPQPERVPVSRAHLVWWTCVESTCGGLVGLLAVGLAAMGEPMTPAVGLSLAGAVVLGTMLGALVSLSRPRTTERIK